MSSCPVRLSFQDPLPEDLLLYSYESAPWISFLVDRLPRFFWFGPESDDSSATILDFIEGNDADAEYLVKLLSLWIVVSAVLLLWLVLLMCCHYKRPKSLFSGQRPMISPPPTGFSSSVKGTSRSSSQQSRQVFLPQTEGPDDLQLQMTRSSTMSNDEEEIEEEEQQQETISPAPQVAVSTSSSKKGSGPSTPTSSTSNDDSVHSSADDKVDMEDASLNSWLNALENHNTTTEPILPPADDEDARNQAFFEDDDDDDEADEEQDTPEEPVKHKTPPSSPPLSPTSKLLLLSTPTHQAAVPSSPYSSRCGHYDDDEDEGSESDVEIARGGGNTTTSESSINSSSILSLSFLDESTDDDDGEESSSNASSTMVQSTSSKYDEYRKYLEEAASSRPTQSLLGKVANGTHDSSEDADDLDNDKLVSTAVPDDPDDWLLDDCLKDVEAPAHGASLASPPDASTILLDSLNTTDTSFPEGLASTTEMSNDGGDDIGFLLFQDTSLDESADHYPEDSLLFNNNKSKSYHQTMQQQQQQRAPAPQPVSTSNAASTPSSQAGGASGYEPLSSPSSTTSSSSSRLAATSLPHSRYASQAASRKRILENYVEAFKMSSSSRSLMSNASDVAQEETRQESPSSVFQKSMATTNAPRSDAQAAKVSPAPQDKENSQQQHQAKTIDAMHNNNSTLNNDDDTFPIDMSTTSAIILQHQNASNSNNSNSNNTSNSNNDDTLMNYEMSSSSMILQDKHFRGPAEEKKEEPGDMLIARHVHVQQRQRPISPANEQERIKELPAPLSLSYDNNNNAGYDEDKEGQGHDSTKSTPNKKAQQASSYNSPQELAVAWKEWSKQESKYECQLQIMRILVVFLSTVLIVSSLLLTLNGVAYLQSQTTVVLDTWEGVMDKAEQLNDFLETLQQLQNSVLQQAWNIWQLLDQTCPFVRPKICSLNSDQCNVTGIPLQETWEEWLHFVQPSNVINLYQGEQWDSLQDDLATIKEFDEDNFQTSTMIWTWSLWVACACNSTLAILVFCTMVGTSFESFERFLNSKWFAVLFWTMVGLAYVFATIFWVGTVVTADACNDDSSPAGEGGRDTSVQLGSNGTAGQVDNNYPDPVVLALMDQHFQAHSPLGDYWEYSINGCQSESYPPLVNDRIWLWANLLPPTERLADGLESLDPQEFEDTCGTSADALASAASVLNLQLCMVAQQLANVRRILACDQWYPFYQTIVYEAVCSQGSQGLLWGAAAQIVILLSAFMIWTFRAAFLPMKSVDDMDTDTTTSSSCCCRRSTRSDEKDPDVEK